MRRLSITFAISVLCFLATLRLTADDKPGATVSSMRLVGKWEEGFFVRTEDAGENKTLIEFTSEGVIKRKVILSNVTIIDIEGKYTVDGNKLTMVTNLPDGKVAREVAIVTKLTESELVLRRGTEKTDSFKRVKGAKN